MKTADIFSDNMVLQANKEIRIFGTGDGVAKVWFCGQEKETKSKDGKWEISLDEMPYGGPYEMKIQLNDETVVIKNVMIGEVFLCAGQSNLQMTIEEEDCDETAIEENSMIRSFFLTRPEEHPGYSSDAGWMECKQENIKHWSALGFHIAENLHNDKYKDVAIGLVCCYQGASVIQSWLPEEIFEKNPDYDIPIELLQGTNHTNPNYVWNKKGLCYHFMFEKMIPFNVGKVIWYQGEGNTYKHDCLIYKDLLAELIKQWRADLRDNELPFIVIQICDLDIRNDEEWRVVQRAQLEIEKIVDNVVSVTSSDVCEEHDSIHPPKKQKLGKKIEQVILEMDAEK